MSSTMPEAVEFSVHNVHLIEFDTLQGVPALRDGKVHMTRWRDIKFIDEDGNCMLAVHAFGDHKGLNITLLPPETPADEPQTEQPCEEPGANDVPANDVPDDDQPGVRDDLVIITYDEPVYDDFDEDCVPLPPEWLTAEPRDEPTADEEKIEWWTKSSTECPGCDQPSGLHYHMGQLWHPDCWEKFKEEFNRDIDATDRF